MAGRPHGTSGLSVGRPTKRPDVSVRHGRLGPTVSFSRAYIYGSFEASFNQDYYEQFFSPSQVFLTKFSKEVFVPKFLSLFCFKFLKNQKKTSFGNLVSRSSFLYQFKSFFQVFFLCFIFLKSFVHSHT